MKSASFSTTFVLFNSLLYILQVMKIFADLELSIFLYNHLPLCIVYNPYLSFLQIMVIFADLAVSPISIICIAYIFSPFLSFFQMLFSGKSRLQVRWKGIGQSLQDARRENRQGTIRICATFLDILDDMNVATLTEIRKQSKVQVFFVNKCRTLGQKTDKKQ